jgi:hypothetical protein
MSFNSAKGSKVLVLPQTILYKLEDAEIPSPPIIIYKNHFCVSGV